MCLAKTSYIGPRKMRLNSINPGMIETEGTRASGMIGSDMEKWLISQAPLGRTGQVTDINPIPRRSQFSTWLVQIAINEARLRLRRDRRDLHRSLDDCLDGDGDEYVPRNFEDWREIPSNALQQAELRGALKCAMNSLARKYREVLILRDVEHLSIEETARVLGLTPGNVKTRLRRARLQMRDALAPGFTGSWTHGRFDLRSAEVLPIS